MSGWAVDDELRRGAGGRTVRSSQIALQALSEWNRWLACRGGRSNETRACHYETSSTRDWIIDRHPGLENVWLAGGGSAEGFKFGPMIGELIATRVLETGDFAELTSNFRLPDEG